MIARPVLPKEEEKRLLRAETVDRAHGRIEKRSIEMAPNGFRTGRLPAFLPASVQAAASAASPLRDSRPRNAVCCGPIRRAGPVQALLPTCVLLWPGTVTATGHSTVPARS